MMDLAVINGLVFIEGGFRKADVGIKDGKLSAQLMQAENMFFLAELILMYIIVILATGSVRHLRLVHVQQQPVDVQHSLSTRSPCRRSGTERF